FFGGILFVVYERIVSTDDPWKVSIWLPFVTAALWFVTLLVKHPYIHLIPEINSLCQKPVFSNWAVVVLLPLTILSLALWQAKKSQAGQRFSKIGDITYSMYPKFPCYCNEAGGGTPNLQYRSIWCFVVSPT